MPEQVPVLNDPKTDPTAVPTYAGNGTSEWLTKVEDQVALMNVGLNKVNEQMLGVTESIKELKSEVQLFDNGIAGVNAKIDKLEKSFNDKLTGEIDGLEKNLKDKLKDKIDGVNGITAVKIDVLEKSLNAKIDALEKYLNAKFDAKINVINAKINVINDKINAINVNFDKLEKRFYSKY
ncbi:MAG: hypothetical protein LBF58_09025 [Deltaproteobacteria bacterium]|jgi:chaperonin cofactor prefoldin|nr:hypothetical protein [Deltaproteobacteria bacterium]